MSYYYKDKKELQNDSLKEKIDRLLLIGKNDCEEFLERCIKNKEYNMSIEDCKERNVKIGSLVRGIGWFHELDETYEVIGFMVESETEFRGKKETKYGFRGVYFGESNKFAPINFDEAVALDDYGVIANGLGDSIEIMHVIEDKEIVNQCIEENDIDINKYLKESNLYLEPKERDMSI